MSDCPSWVVLKARALTTLYQRCPIPSVRRKLATGFWAYPTPRSHLLHVLLVQDLLHGRQLDDPSCPGSRPEFLQAIPAGLTTLPGDGHDRHDRRGGSTVSHAGLDRR